MLKKRSRILPLLVVLACALIATSCGGAATQTGSPSATSQPTPASRPTQGPLSTQGPLQASPPSASGSLTITGQVMLIYANGGILLNDGRTSYTVDMTPITSAINLRGREVPRQFIQVAGSVTVTGQLSGATITAQVVSIPTTKDGP